MDMVGGPESKSVTTGKPMSSQLQHGKLIQPALIRPRQAFFSSGESSGRSSGGRVGPQLGRLGPLTGRRVF
jgi:hypothetical protein